MKHLILSALIIGSAAIANAATDSFIVDPSNGQLVPYTDDCVDGMGWPLPQCIPGSGMIPFDGTAVIACTDGMGWPVPGCEPGSGIVPVSKKTILFSGDCVDGMGWPLPQCIPGSGFVSTN